MTGHCPHVGERGWWPGQGGGKKRADLGASWSRARRTLPGLFQGRGRREPGVRPQCQPASELMAGEERI